MEAWGQGVFQEMLLMERRGGRWPALEAVRQTGEHTHLQDRIKEMGGGVVPASPYGLVSWAKVNRRWDPSFQPVGIELSVAERESQAYGLVFEVSNVTFGPLHRLTQQIAG